MGASAATKAFLADTPRASPAPPLVPPLPWPPRAARGRALTRDLTVFFDQDVIELLVIDPSSPSKSKPS